MANQRLTAGGYLDILTKDELKESLGHDINQEIRELYKGVDYLSFTGSAGGAVGSFTIPYAPEAGYCWSLKLVSVQLAGISSVAYYIGTNPIGGAAIGVTTSSGGPNNDYPITFTSNVVVLKDGQQITVATNTTAINYYHMRVKQVPTVMQGKL